MTSVHDTVDVQISSKGAVAHDVREYARAKLTRATRYARQPVLRAHLHLRLDPNPALDRPAIAKAQVDVSGRLVCAHVSAGDMHEAIDLLEGRIRRGLDALAGRDEGRHHETGSAPPGEWRHGDLATVRPEYFPRPVDDRENADAVGMLDLSGERFVFFVDRTSGRGSIVYRRYDGHYGLVTPGAGG